jgi:hypothetical protein
MGTLRHAGSLSSFMAGLVPAIHEKAWITGTSPVMNECKILLPQGADG